MKAAVLREVNQPVVVEDVQVDAPAPREVLVRTGRVGRVPQRPAFCRRSVHYAHALHPGPRGRRHRGGRGPSRSANVRPGDLVIMCLSVFCGTCEFCTRGQPYLCDRTAVTRRRDDPPRLR